MGQQLLCIGPADEVETDHLLARIAHRVTLPTHNISGMTAASVAGATAAVALG